MLPEKFCQNLSAILTALFLMAFLPMPAGASQIYSLADCLEIAVNKHPSVISAHAAYLSSSARLSQTAAADRLKADASASAARNGAETRDSSNYSLGVTASLKLYDANRGKYSLDAAGYTLMVSEMEERHTRSAVRGNVKSAFLTLLLSYETENQRGESVRSFEQHLEQTRDLYEAGSRPWYDVIKAEVDLGNAQMSLVEASANTRDAKASLASAMGLDPSADFEIKRTGLDVLSVPDGVPETAETQLFSGGRLDYLASLAKVDAGKSTLAADARANSPSVSLSGGYNGTADDSLDFERGWNAGIRMSVPIIDGGAAKAEISAARAQISSLEASREKLRQDILLEVSRAKSNILKARERIRISEIVLRNAEENRKLAEGRYEMGVGSALEVTDAIVSFTDAVLSGKQARYDLQIAIVNLEQAAGTEFGLK